MDRLCVNFLDELGRLDVDYFVRRTCPDEPDGHHLLLRLLLSWSKVLLSNFLEYVVHGLLVCVRRASSRECIQSFFGLKELLLKIRDETPDSFSFFALL